MDETEEPAPDSSARRPFKQGAVPRILVIDDEPDLRALLRVVLIGGGYEVLEAGDGLTGMRLLHVARPALVLLDIVLPGLNGWEVLRRIREISEVPVIVVSAQDREHDKVRGLDAGADDYITKPFGRAELLARCNAQLRRTPLLPVEPQAVHDGRLQVDFLARRVTLDGAVLALTAQEYRLLVVLLGHAGRTLSNVDLLNYAWGDPSGVGADRVKFVMLRLRRKFEQGTPPYRPITSTRGLGYRFDMAQLDT